MGSIVRRFAVLSFLVVAAAPVRAQGRPIPPLPARQRLVATRQAFRAERHRIGNALRNGSITQEQGRQKLQEWRREHRPNAGLRGPRRPGGGE